MKSGAHLLEEPDRLAFIGDAFGRPAGTVSVGRMAACHMPEPPSLQASQLQPIQQPPFSCLVFSPLRVYLNVVYLALGTPLCLPIPSLLPTLLPALSSDSSVAELATVF